MSPFQPSGETAQWRLVYEVLQDHEVGDVVTYEALSEVLDDAPRHTVQMAARRAGKEYLEVDKRALEAVQNVGYRIVEAGEHLRLAKNDQRKSSRALQRGHSKVVNVDLSSLDDESRKAFEIVAQAFALQMDFNRRMDVRQKRLEQAVGAIAERHDRTESEIAELRARLDRLTQT